MLLLESKFEKKDFITRGGGKKNKFPKSCKLLYSDNLVGI